MEQLGFLRAVLGKKSLTDQEMDSRKVRFLWMELGGVAFLDAIHHYKKGRRKIPTF